MLLSLSLQGWIFLGFFLAAGGFFVGSALHGVMGSEGFGPIGNMIILMAGAIGGGILIEYTPYRHMILDPTIMAVLMVSSAFIFLAFLVLTKFGLNRLGA